MRRYLRLSAWGCIAGAIFLLGKIGYARYDWQKRIELYEMVQGIVIDRIPNADSTQFFPVISFKAIDRQKLKIKSRQADNAAAVGDTVQVLYDLANPDDMLLVHLHPIGKSNVNGAWAAFLLATGALILLMQGRQNRRRNQLKTSGKTIHAVYKETQSFSLLGIRFYRGILVAKTEYPQPRELHFVSEWFTEDPAPYWQGKTVQVHVNINREEDYWVNTELIPARALI